MIKRLLFALLLCTSPVLATINIEVPIEMLPGYGAQSAAAGAVTFTHSTRALNTNDYDGAEYWFELVCWNNVGSAQDIYLVDSGDTTMATINFDQTGANAWTLERDDAAWTPNAGADTYRLKLPQTAGGDDLIRCQSARIVVLQTNATKTRIQIPLTARISGTHSDTQLLDQTTSTTYTQGDTTYYPMWKKTASDWATVTGATIEMTGWHQSGTETITATIWNVTDGAAVTGAQATLTTSTHSHDDTDFSWANLDDLDEYDCRFKSSTAGSNARLSTCVMYIELSSSATAVETYWMLHQGDIRSAAYEHSQNMAIINTSGFSSPVVYQEATIAETSSGTVTIQVSDCGVDQTNPSSCTPVSGADLSTASSSNDLVRSSSLTITDDDVFISEVSWSSGTLEIVSNHLVVQATGSAASGAGESRIGRGSIISTTDGTSYVSEGPISR